MKRYGAGSATAKLIKGYRVGQHTVMIDEGQEPSFASTEQKVAIYTRVSSAENKTNLNSRACGLLLRDKGSQTGSSCIAASRRSFSYHPRAAFDVLLSRASPQQ